MGVTKHRRRGRNILIRQAFQYLTVSLRLEEIGEIFLRTRANLSAAKSSKTSLRQLQSQTRYGAHTGGGFRNEENIGNNLVHAGDAGLGFGTTGQQRSRPGQWTGHSAECTSAGANTTIRTRKRRSDASTRIGVERAGYRGLSGRNGSELHDHGQSGHPVQTESSSELQCRFAEVARGRIGASPG